MLFLWIKLYILKTEFTRKGLICLFKMPFCLQDDVVMGTLTVRENLQFSAALRLPSTMKSHEKNERINMVIQELGLAKVADSKVMGTQLMGSLPASRTSPVWVVLLLFRSFYNVCG